MICLQKKRPKRRKYPFSVSTASYSAETLKMIYELAHLDIPGGPATASKPPDIISRIMHGAVPVEFRYSPEGQALVDEWYERLKERERECLFHIFLKVWQSRLEEGSARLYAIRCVLRTLFV